MSRRTDPVVLHVIEAVRGGTARHLVDLVAHVQGVEHHVAAPPARASTGSGASFDRAALEQVRAAGGSVHEVDMRRQPAHPVNARAFLELRALIGRLRPDVVHGHSSLGGALARLAQPGLTRPGRRLPVVYTPHGLVAGTGYRLVERALGTLTARWVAVSDSEAADAARLRLVPPERLVTIPNGVDLEATFPDAPDLRGLLNLDPGLPLVGTVARLVPQKAPSVFVRVCAEVARQLPSAHFVLIGMGPLQDEVDREVARARLGERWRRIQHLEEAAGVFDQLDVFVLASSFEGGPYTPLEAMRAGVPVVLSDVVGNRDAVLDGVTGVLAPLHDPVAMGRQVVRLIEDPALRASLVGAAGATLAERFDVKVMARRLGEMYRDLAAS